MKLIKLIPVVLLFALVTVTPVISLDRPPETPDTYYFVNYNSYKIWYNNGDPYDSNTPPERIISDTQAYYMRSALDNAFLPSNGKPNGYLAGYHTLGFLEPWWEESSTRPIITYDCKDCDSGMAYWHAILMPSILYQAASEQCIRNVLGHELFHHVEWRYIHGNGEQGPEWNNVAIEGFARLMEDKVYSDLDAMAGGCSGTLFSEVNGYVATPYYTNFGFWKHTYGGAVFWNYLTEQLGTTTQEPQVGVDFVVNFWDLVKANYKTNDVASVARQTIAKYSATETLEDLYQDFTITNYLKDKDVSLLPNPQRYTYKDEHDGNNLTFLPVALHWQTTILPTQQKWTTVNQWAANYLEADTSACPNGVVGVKVHGRAIGGSDVQPAGFAAVTIANGKVQKLVKHEGASFSLSFVKSAAMPISRLALIVTGRNKYKTYFTTFDCGAASLTIHEPEDDETIAYVGSPGRQPDPFLIKLQVQGPSSLGSPSVEGLSKGDFQVYVGDVVQANLSTIINVEVIQGEYWISVIPPFRNVGDPTEYNLTVKILNGGSALNEGAVHYEEKQVDQILVID